MRRGFERGEISPLSDTDHPTPVKDQKEFLRTCFIIVLCTWAFYEFLVGRAKVGRGLTVAGSDELRGEAQRYAQTAPRGNMHMVSEHRCIQGVEIRCAPTSVATRQRCGV